MFHPPWPSLCPSGCCPRDNHPPHLLLFPGTPVSFQDSGKQVYTNLAKPDKMNVQLFLFLAAYFSLYQNCSYTLLWWSSTENNCFIFFTMLKKPPKVFCWLIPAGFWIRRCGRLWTGSEGCVSSHSLSTIHCFCSQVVFRWKRHFLVAPAIWFGLSTLLSLLSLNGVCTIWTFSLWVDRIFKWWIFSLVFSQVPSSRKSVELAEQSPHGC